MDPKGVASVLLDGHALEFNVERPFTYASGLTGPIYIDCRILLSDLTARSAISGAIAEALGPLKFDVVAATATGAIPWGAWVADIKRKPLVYVRGEAKAHGKGNVVEGRIDPGATAVVIEDIVNRGGSSMKTISGLRGVGAVVNDCVTIYDYGTSEAHEAFNKAGVKLYSLSNFGAAVEVAVAKGYLTGFEAAEAREWAKDPMRWRK